MPIEWGLPTVCDILNGAVNLIKRPVKYAMSSKSFADGLREEVGKLENEARRVQDLAQVARNNRRILDGCFTGWQQRADKAFEEARKLSEDFDEASKTCCYGRLPDPYCRYRFSTKAEAEIQVVRGLAQDCIRFKALDDICSINTASGNVTAPTPVRGDGKDAGQSTTATASAFSASTSIKLRNDEVFESRALMIREIMDALADNSNSVVGVYGMGGIGKSTLLGHVERKISEEKSFDWVAKADVSENPDIKTIQGEIADALGLTEIKNKETISGRAKLLHGRLKDEEREKKKVLIILDNLWEGLDLNKVGILGGSHNNVMGCKLLLTSRDRDVLRREMGCDKAFYLSGLKEEEAKRLFERMVGDKVHDDKFKPWVKVALDKCAGVPFLIDAMGKRFKDAELYEWRNTLKNFEEFKDKETKDLINHMLQWSYDKLEEDVKSLLRLCVVYSISKPSLENLVRYGFGLGLFGEVSSMEEARDRLHLQIRTLQASSLLLESEDVDGFKIHDLVREFVALVVSRDHHLLVLKDKDKSTLELLKDKLNSCRAVCFPYIDMEELPQELDCPELQIFLFFTNKGSLKVPDLLFHSMRKLMVLNLTRIRLTCSPLSPFQFLENLHTLCLDECSLDNVAILGELKGLQILSFVNSNIHRLPKEIGQLVELRLLELNHCPQLEIIEPGILQSLIKLEELYMKGSFNQWNTMDQTPPTNASLIELNHMKNLRTLHVSIPNSSVLPEDLNVEKLTKYEIKIGNVLQGWKKCKGSRTLELKSDPLGNVLWKGCIQSILGKTDYLFLDKLDKNEQSVCTLSQKGFPELKHLQVQNSSSIHYILQLPSHTHFTMLESLLLNNLINLEMICNGQFSSKSFSTLKVVRVKSCDKMEVLFPLSVVRGLPQLEEIEVVSCKLMRMIIEVDDCGKFELRNLHVLKLCNLPDIKSFFNIGLAPSSNTSGNQVSTQIAFFNGQQVSIPSLESLTMEGLPNLKEIWSDESPLELSNLQSLTVARCESLLTVISSQSLLKLDKLHTLIIRDCVSVQEIFDLDGQIGSGNVETLSQLTFLKLNKMRSLRCIWNKNPCGIVSFHILKELEVDECDNLRFMFFPSMVKSLTQVKDLSVEDCKKMEAIIMEEEGLGMETSEILALPMLTNLNLKNLESLKCFSHGKCSLEARSQDRVQSYSTALFNREVAFPSLKTLDIEAMDIEKIWDNQVAMDSFHNLKSLYVDGCNKLVNLVPSCMLGRLLSLEILEASDCGALEVVFKLQPPNTPNGHIIPLPLKQLTVSSLPELKCVWDKELHHQVKFQCLSSISVFKCKNLTSLFPALVARNLLQLEKLKIDECGIAEIIEKEDGLVPRFVFPKLISLELKDLRELKCIYTGKHTFCWPALKSLKVHGCDKVEILASHLENEMPLDKQPLFLIEKVAFPSLEALNIASLDNIEMIWDNQAAANSFPKLKSLCVDRCNKLVNIVCSFILRRLLSLERLDARRCGSLEVVFELQPQNHLDRNPIALPLKELTVSKLPKLKCVWDKELCCQVKFQGLRSISISRCESLASLFPTSVAKDLMQLEELKIDECGIAEIIEKEDGLVPRFVFPKLTSLELKYLRELKCLYIGTHTSHWPTLKSLKVHGCDKVEILVSHLENEMPLDKHPLFLIEKVAFPSLEALNITSLDNIEMIWDNQVDVNSFPKLKSLCVDRCNKLVNIVCSFILRRLLSLERLDARRCGSLEVVFELQPQNHLDRNPVALPLKELTVSELPKLKCVWDKELHCQVKFQGLRSISVSRCERLVSLFPTSVAKDLMQLEKLKIGECGIVELIEKEEGLVPKFVFPKLISLELKDLRELKCIYTGKHTFCWPALKSLKVHGCDKVEILASHLENEMPLDKHPLFLIEKVAFPSLEALNIASLDNIEMIWDNQVAANSFPKLKSLCVDRCNKLVNIVCSFILRRLLSLERLDARRCGSLEVVFELQPQNHLDRNPIALPLKELTVSELPKLKCVWDKELCCQVKFQGLRSISISRCESLASLFPTSVAKDLMQLEELKIDECGIAEIIEKEDGLVPRFVFPKLTSLELNYLRELKCLYVGTHTSNWPALKSLKVHGCEKVEILASHLENEMPLDKQPLFLIEKGAFPNLQELKLDLSERMEIWHGHFHDGEFFCKLSLLKLCHLSQESSISTCRFIESLTNLEELVICESYLEDPSSNEEAIEGTSHEMKVILPFSRYIRHLQTLDVSHCDGLSKMFTPTIAENLVALAKLRISNCRILTEIINNEKGGDGRVVAFNQLKYMELDGLIGLRSFSSGGYTLMFPLLEDIIVTRCPNMKFFSQGLTEASKLKRVRVSEEAWFWAGNLDITIQNMFEEMGTLARAKKMLLSEFPELIGKWHNELNPIKSYWQLKSMVVDKCPSFINAIPSRLMLVLDNLDYLQVCDCKLLEEIFDLEGLEVVESTQILPRLQKLNLANLPKLRRLWNQDLQESICFDSLTTLILYNCGNLGHAFASSMARCLANLVVMKIKECGQMEEVIVEEEGQGSTVEKITFSNLRRMKLECLPNLTCFLSRKNHVLDCPKLEVMIIAHCPKMESLIGQSRMEDDHGTPSLFTSQVQFPELWSMDLSHMDNLSKIWTNTPQETLTFDCLRKVEVRNCKGLENLFPYWVATSLTHLEKLQVESCEIEEIVANGGDTPRSNTTQDIFPKLTSLVLRDMPRLKSFYPNLPTLHWPLLEELRVTHCDKLNMLSFTASMNSWAQKYDQQDLSNQEVHSSFERDFPNFKRLLLVNNNIQMIQDGNFPDDFFSKPKALTLACFHDEKAVFPSIFLLERFRNLQSLEVFCSSFEDIFPNEGLVEEGKHSVLENLREIKLNKLHNLKRVWREDSLVSKILQSIKTYEIWDCPCLTTIFPTVASFHNLTELVVKNSSGLVHLVTVSTVTNLMHLDTMTIIGCERMKEVVANDGNGEGKVISFGNLSYLTLQDLPSLECFSSISSCTFRFPWLHSIEVEECPKMKTFSKGTLSTPQLDRVSLFRYKWEPGNWEEGDDLNTTIQKLSA